MSVLRGKELREYKKGLNLSEIQESLLIGSMLGDGNLRITGENTEANFTVDHSEDQKDYVFWKYEIMEKWVLTPPKRVTRTYHKDPSRETISWRFLTISHPEFTRFYDLFYREDGPKETEKVLPESIKELLEDPLSLAVWFMDDGTKSGESIFLNTQNFTRKEQEGLIECLKENFGVEGRINIHSHWEGKTFYRIRINTSSLERFFGLLEPYILPQFSYKIP